MYIILASILLLRVVQSVCGKSCSKLMPEGSHRIIKYMSLRMGISALAAIVLLAFGGNVIEDLVSMPLLGWILSLFTGVCLTSVTILSLLVMKRASIVLTSLSGMAGLLVPTIAGIFLYNQPVKTGQWLGILILFTATFFLSSSSQKTNGKINFKTVLMLLAYMLSNGTIMLLQTMYKTYVPNGNVSLYSFLQFAIPSVVMLIISCVWSLKVKQPIPKSDNKLLGFTVFAAAALFGISQISTIASSIIPVAVLFPISDGGSMVISALVAAVVFKEKFTVKSACGVIIGIVGIIMIKLLA